MADLASPAEEISIKDQDIEINNSVKSEKLERQREPESKPESKRNIKGPTKDEYIEIIRNNELNENTIKKAENTIKEEDQKAKLA